MSEKLFRRILFTALMLVAPTLIFLVQVVFVVPTVFLPAGLGYMLYKLAAHGWDNEMPIFLGFFLLHLILFGGLYALLAWLCGRIAGLLPGGWRVGLLALLLAGLAALSQLPIYGGGGHGPAHFGPLQYILTELNRDYGEGSILAVYTAALILGLQPVVRHCIGRWRNG